MKLAIVLLVACGPSQPSKPTGPPPSDPQGCIAETAPPTCASDPAASPTCEQKMFNARCATASAICVCRSPFTGGAPPPPNQTGDWLCVPPTRADGCPGLEPPQNGCCTGPDHECAYPTSGREHDDYVVKCQSGRWFVVHMPAPFA